LPELPEVETVRRGLEPVLHGRVIERADVRRPDLRRPFPPRLAERLRGARVTGLRRRSKYLLIDLDRGETLIAHLGMSGRLLLSGAPLGAFVHPRAAPQKHDHVVLDIEGGARVTFNDARRFGLLDLWPTEGLESHRLLAGLGPEPLGNGFDGPYLAARLAGRATTVKAALGDQRTVAGLGNIYVCEALWRARVSPLRLARDVTPAEAEGLAAAVRSVLADAIAAGGSSLRDYRQADGELGYFQHSFAVYGREGEPCPRPGCPGRIARAVQSGRSSFFCPTCQH
jgi:formamidopyrimidine-DNA glycosylase